jgi:hypothetical protein
MARLASNEASVVAQKGEGLAAPHFGVCALRRGYNPYIVVPSDPAAKGLHTPETRNLNIPDLPSPYPAGAQLFSAQ